MGLEPVILPAQNRRVWMTASAPIYK